MASAPYPPDEIKRLAAVHRLRLVGTPAEERFDKITRLAKRMFDVPIAALDIIERSRVWLKSVEGLGDQVEGHRVESFCQWAILEGTVCNIPDTLQDPRTADSPYAKDIRFYAGAPLSFQGQRVGVLCVADSQPRMMGAQELEALADLAAMAEAEFEKAGLSEIQLALALANEELSERALVDGLTKLWNRSAITEIAVRELEQARLAKGPVGVALVDIDHFKRVNDTHGHPAGDAVLRGVADRLRTATRPTDATGRYGGEEFLLVFPGLGQQDAVAACERVRQAVAEWPVADIPVTISTGVTVSSYGTHFLELLTKAADMALYRAKRGGRNRVEARWITPSIQAPLAH